MKAGYTHITLLLDESGSMEPTRLETISAVNAFIAEQKKVPGEATFTLVKFNNVAETIYDHVDLKTVRPLNEVVYRPNLLTALYDAWGGAIKSTGKFLASLKEEDRPEKVVFVVLTDGAENMSKEYTKQAVLELVEHQKKDYNWAFLYLGANQDAIATGQSLGVGAANSLNYSQSKLGVVNVTTTVSSKVSEYRSSDVRCMSAFTDQEREANKPENNK
jgi:uncharacterized protein YegL